GCWILVRLDDLANDDKNRELVKSVGNYFVANYTDDHVIIDKSTFNPARLMCLPGTAKCKGNAQDPQRPWRLATLDSPPDHRPRPIADPAAWLASQPGAGLAVPAKARHKIKHESVPTILVPAQTAARPGRPSDFEWARKYVLAAPGAVSGQRGHDQT